MSADDSTDDGDGPADDGADGSEPDGLLERIDEMDTERWAESIVMGAVTYVIGYIVVAVLFFLGPAPLGDGLSTSEKFGKVGVTFNAAHFVDVQADEYVVAIGNGEVTELGTRFGLFEINNAVGASQAVPAWGYLAIPIVLLLTVGFSRAYRLTGEGDTWDPVKTTLGVPLGYGAVAYLGGFVFAYPIGPFRTVADFVLVTSKGAISGFVEQGNVTRILVANSSRAIEIQGNYQKGATTTVTLTPDPGSALLMGILYPLAFATVGALLAVSVVQMRAD